MTKREVFEAAAKGEGCLGRSADDEPVFVLCARDVTAATAVRKWATSAELRGDVPLGKIAAAFDVANAMDIWRATHGGKAPD